MLHRREFLIALGGAVACARPVCRDPGPSRDAPGSATHGKGTSMSNDTTEWLQRIWSGSDIGFHTPRPLLKVFQSPEAWRRFIKPLWLNADKVVTAGALDWSEWVLLLMLAEASSDPQKDLIVREAARADGEVIIKLDIEPDPKARRDLDVQRRLSMIARGSRKVFRPETRVQFEIAGRKGIVTHD